MKRYSFISSITVSSTKRSNKDSKFTSNFTGIYSSNIYLRHMSNIILFRTIALRAIYRMFSRNALSEL